MSINNEEVTVRLPNGGPLVAPSETQSTATSRETNYQATSPIHRLPAEVLANIIGIVVCCELCCRDDNYWLTKDSTPRYPDLLSHVCSRWRQVAVRSRSLWSHIDVTEWHTSGSRAMTFLDRAGQSPLRLHFVGHLNTHKQGNNPVDRVPFLAPMTSQLESLELIPLTDNLSNTHTSALSICLSACTAGNLTELVLRIIDGYQVPAPIFIKARNHVTEAATPTDNTDPIWVDVDIPQARLENILRGITVLRLCQVYPQWASSAYRGLVELRLVAGILSSVKITESQLVGILRSSPKLRILHFYLKITDIASLDTEIVDPITLSDLEVLNLGWMQENGIEIFFRWLAPAPKLSQFSLHPTGDDMGFGHPATEAFLTNSNITMMHANHLYIRELIGVTRLCRHIHVLALENFELGDTEWTVPIQFNTLYLIESEFLVHTLRQMTRSCSVQRFIIYHSNFYRGSSVLPSDQVLAELFDVCSDVSILPDGDPDPIQGWELFWHK